MEMDAAPADVEFFLARCTERRETTSEIVLVAANRLHADGLKRCTVALANRARGKKTLIHWPGDEGLPYEIGVSFAANVFNTNPSKPLQSNIKQEKPIQVSELLFVPEPELTEPLVYNASKPTYINRIFDQENLFANPAALEAQGQKPKFVGMTGYALNDPDELDRRCNFLINGEILQEYEYEAWRWYFDLEANRWMLKRMYFVSNFRRINHINLGKHLQFRDTPCWLGEVLRADELPRRAA